MPAAAATDRLFRLIREAESDSERTSAAAAIRSHVSEFAKQVSGEEFAKFMQQAVNKRIFELIHSKDSTLKLAGISIIDSLIDFHGEDNTIKITRFANYLRVVLPGSEPAVSNMAAKALAHLAKPGGTLAAEFVEFEVKRALEWLQETTRNESKRYSAVIVLKELAISSPSLIISHVTQILDLIWTALSDRKVMIREQGAEVLAACLRLMHKRESSLRKQWYAKIYEEAERLTSSTKPHYSSDILHGCLLAYRELFNHGGKFMESKFVATAGTIFRFRESSDSLIRITAIELFPTLAHYDTEIFVSRYLSTCIDTLVRDLWRERAKAQESSRSSAAFLAIGKISITVGLDILPYLDLIFRVIKEDLHRARIQSKGASAALKCLSMLCRIKSILNLMFQSGLSLSLNNTLTDISNVIPSLRRSIQDRFLDILSLILCGEPYRHPGAPRCYSQQQQQQVTLVSETARRQPELIVLALNCLGTFDFSGILLQEVILSCARKYLNHSFIEIRKAAVVTCCKLLTTDPVTKQLSRPSLLIMEEVLERLMIVAVTDSDTLVRHTVLTSLPQEFDDHLARTENVNAIFHCLNDSALAVRETTMALIGRLGLKNPAYVLPRLRQLLIGLVTELQFTSTSLQKEDCARLLCELVIASKDLTKAYVGGILKILLPRATDAIPGVAAKCITAIGELSRVATTSSEFLKNFDNVMAVIISALQDQSSSAKREASLKALGQICSNTGIVISPYIKYPNLLDILLGVLKSEENLLIRKETVRVIGILGAIDPYRHKMVSVSNDCDVEVETIAQLTSSADEYYPTIALEALRNILKDSSLMVHHSAVIQAVMYMFETLGQQFVPFLPQILPDILKMIKICPPTFLEFYFTKLSDLVLIVKQHIRNYLPAIFELVDACFFGGGTSANTQTAILYLLESISQVLGIEFKVYLPTLLPRILEICGGEKTDSLSKPLSSSLSENYLLSQKCLHSLVVFGESSQDYLHLVTPTMMELLERPAASAEADVSMGAILALACRLGQEFVVFLPCVTQAMADFQIKSQVFDAIVGNLRANEVIPMDLFPKEFLENTQIPATNEVTHQSFRINQMHLQRSWDTSEKSTREDWVEWMRRLSVELLKESPSHSLRSCASLAAVYNPLARELFNAAFLSCWAELLDQFKEDLIKSIEIAIKAPNISPDITQTLLNMAEFMEHDDKPLPIDIRTLSQYATKCHAWAKALHYKEMEYLLDPAPSAVESLISINNQLDQPDAAVGIVVAQKLQPEVTPSTWHEKLNRWEEALSDYEQKQLDNPASMDALFGRMRCLQNLGEWESLSSVCQKRFYSSLTDDAFKKVMAPLAASAAWTLGQWGFMRDCVDLIKVDSPDGAFFRSVLDLHDGRFSEAAEHIGKARELLDTEFMALIGESYSRAYPVVVRMQMLAELEEIIRYKQLDAFPEQQELIRKTWMSRLQGCQKTVDIWQRILRVRTLVISPSEGADMWIKFANLCRKSEKLALSFKTLTSLLHVSSNDLGILDTSNNPPPVIYACLKHAWASGVRDVQENAFEQLRQFTKTLVDRLNLKNLNDISEYIKKNKSNLDSMKTMKLIARCYVKMGEWQKVLEDEGMNDDCIPEILLSFTAATHCDKDWYKAWHSWALTNVEVLQYHERISGTVNSQVIISHVVPSIKGFFHSIALSKDSSLQDVLRLTTLWFKYGYSQDINGAVSDGFGLVSIDTWLQVIPQLIARIHTVNPHVRKLLHQLISDLGRAHPQALVWSLTVASQSQNANRRTAALNIMDRMKSHSSNLVEQVLLVSQELLRVAILWPEMWFSGIEDASKCYYGENDIPGMFSILEPLHNLLDRGPETEREKAFNDAYSVELKDAWEWCNRYKKTRNEKDLRFAWDLYYAVFQRLEKQLEHLKRLDLESSSPKLFAATNLELAVPGTYRSGEEVTKIDSIGSILSVMKSKQRPRRISIKGSNGVEFKFLLKGREDIRQDERVMQFFGLVNNLLLTDSETFKRHLNIERFSVIPLSPNSGLIGWVSNTDTFNNLISEYRESKKILLNVEYRLMIQMSANYDILPVINKVEIFEHAIGSTTGQDLFKVLWLKSKNSEMWLDRRTNYTRSLAVMSMVGYILGLGDRHPSNIMMERFTGKVVHIDFGDCFEVAMQRENYPERVPFRLTRLFVNAMGVSGVEGNFRLACEEVMRVLRDNKDSLMAVLEAFVHDPLLNWRLLSTPSPLRVHESHEILAVEAEGLNARAVTAITRVEKKLTGKDFKTQAPLHFKAQVNRLILQASAPENLCQGWVGWCAFW
ncbi:FAT domain-containing protein [Obelidium mucronatum]|nr:FAT domain-containing protein [Obelidium mucronatum]